MRSTSRISTFKSRIAALLRRRWAQIGLPLLFVFVCLMVWFLVHRFVVSPPVNAHIEQTDDLVREGDQIQLSVLNGCGAAGGASIVMDYLRARGFDVVEIANYQSFDVERSFVIDRVGDTLSARKVAYAIGIADSLHRTDIDSSLYLRCSVVLGRDYQQLKAFRDR